MDSHNNPLEGDEIHERDKAFMVSLQRCKKDLLNLHEMKMKLGVLQEIDNVVRGSRGDERQQEFIEKSGLRDSWTSEMKFADTMLSLSEMYTAEIAELEKKLEQSSRDLDFHKDYSDPKFQWKKLNNMEFDCNRFTGDVDAFNNGRGNDKAYEPNNPFTEYSRKMFERNFGTMREDDGNGNDGIYKNIFIGGNSLDHLASLEYDKWSNPAVSREEWMENIFMNAVLEKKEKITYNKYPENENTEISIKTNTANMMPSRSMSVFDMFDSVAYALVTAVEWGIKKVSEIGKMLLSPSELANEEAPEKVNKSVEFKSEAKTTEKKDELNKEIKKDGL
jgi:hypothetical protein